MKIAGTPPTHDAIVGRLTASKGIHVLLQAYAHHADLPPLHIAGDGDASDAQFRGNRRVHRRQR